MIRLMITRANQRASLVADYFLLWLETDSVAGEDRGISTIHFPILDPERPVHSLANLYLVMMDLFAGNNVNVLLHIRVNVSILGIEVGNELP